MKRSFEDGDEGGELGKTFIDTPVSRANDAGTPWLVTAVRTGGLNAAWLVALPAAGLWLVTSFWSGKRHDQRTDTKLDPRENNTYHSHEPA